MSRDRTQERWEIHILSRNFGSNQTGIQRLSIPQRLRKSILLISLQNVCNIRSSDLPKHTVNVVSVYGQEKYLVLEV